MTHNVGSQKQPGLPLTLLKMVNVQIPPDCQKAVGPGCHLG